MQAKPTTPTTEERAGNYLSRVDRLLLALLPHEDVDPGRLHQAMRYSGLAPGKRIRPLLAYAAGESLALAPENIDGIACAVELIHAYSLIHDDLPAMDDDDLRRGRPTCHRAFDEATAILAGDALQALAFEVLAGDRQLGCEPQVQLDMVRKLGVACGSHGMAGGQAIDLDAVGRHLDQESLERMHNRKTGTLIRCAVELPAMAFGDEGHRQALAGFGESIGLAFQIHDDVLDVEGSTDAIGKPNRSDEARDKPTFPSCIGLDGSKQLARQLLGEALAILPSLPGDTDLLQYLARFTVERNH
jgi:farnesyl diphosphate synthase